MKEEPAMPRKFVEVFDRFGNPVDDDIVPDGGRVRVSMMARDGLSPLQHAVAEDKASRVAFDDSAARHQLGPVVLTDRAGIERKAQAYVDSVRDLTEAWRTPSAAPATGTRDATPARPTYDAFEGRRRKEAAWREMVDEMTNAW